MLQEYISFRLCMWARSCSASVLAGVMKVRKVLDLTGPTVVSESWTLFQCRRECRFCFFQRFKRFNCCFNFILEKKSLGDLYFQSLVLSKMEYNKPLAWKIRQIQMSKCEITSKTYLILGFSSQSWLLVLYRSSLLNKKHFIWDKNPILESDWSKEVLIYFLIFKQQILKP